MRTVLNITKCIVIGDARRMLKGKEPVRNIARLSVELELMYEDRYDADLIHHVLRWSEKIGHVTRKDQLLKDLQNVLFVSEEELIKYQ